MNEKKKLLISFSGGRTSAFMTKWLLEHKQNEFEMMVVFANTGKEREETLEFIQECNDKFNFNCVWIEAVFNKISGKGTRSVVVDYNTASRNGEPFEALIQKHGMCNVRNPKCTRELKKHAISAYAKSLGWKKYYTAIGIRIDEIDRISPNATKERYIYPLVSWIPTKRNDINYFWREQDFDLRLKTYEGNCDMCFKKSFRKLMTISVENPKITNWWQEMENKYKDFIPVTQQHNEKIIPPLYFFRQNTCVNQIIEMAKIPFEMAKDESKYKQEYEQLSLFDLDISNGCSESCEVF